MAGAKTKVRTIVGYNNYYQEKMKGKIYALLSG